MVTKEFFSLDQEAGNYEENTTLVQDPYEELEEEEEILSLCDLPIHSDSAQWDHFSNKEEDGHNNDDDFFEFFSEDFSTTSSMLANNSENIIFCGKLIGSKEGYNFEKSSEPMSKSEKSDFDASNSIKKGQEEKGSISKKSFLYTEYPSIGKVSLMRSKTKSRWYLFMFGMSTRLSLSSTEMELSDIKMRQSRRRRVPAATKFPAPEEHQEGKRKQGGNNLKGLWRMLSSLTLGLGCMTSNKLANDVVKAAFV